MKSDKSDEILLREVAVGRKIENVLVCPIVYSVIYLF